MKTIRLLILILLVGSYAYGQETDVKSLLSGGTEVKGFGGVDMKLTSISDNTSFLIGASGGVNVNKFFMLGVAGYGLTTQPDIPTQNPNETLKMYGGYGGLLVGFNIFPREVVHLSIPIVFGGGTFYLDDQNFFPNTSDSDFTVEKSSFLVVEPGALLEFNVTRFFRLGLGASYRYVQGSSLQSLSDEDLSDWTGNLSLKFGSF